MAVMKVRDKSGNVKKLHAVKVFVENGLRTSVVEFTQMNDLVSSYLEDADSKYTDGNGSSLSVMSSYQQALNDRPLGYSITSSKGNNLYLQNEESGEGWMLPVYPDISNPIFNAVPYKVSQFLVKDPDGNLLESGRIKPTGKVRMISFCGYIRNCRDLGGWNCDGGTVKYGLLFRSGTVASSESWIDTKIAKALGIKHHIDFRNDNEANNVTESCLGSDVHYERITLDLYYKDIIDPTSADYKNTKKVMRRIIDSVIYNEPVIFNCSLGRDRTGTIALMLLALLGVSISDIDKDYELSSFAPDEIYCARTRSDYQALQTYLATFGGKTLQENAVWWFVIAGFSISELNAFRSAMIEGTPSELSKDDFYMYTNQLSIATDTDGAIYNSIGYKSSARLSSSGEVTNANGMDATGFIPCVSGDIVRMRGIHFNNESMNSQNHRVCFYDSAKKFIQLAQCGNEYLDPSLILSGVYDASCELVQFTLNENQYTTGCAFIRICGDTFDSNAVITVNEEIV